MVILNERVQKAINFANVKHKDQLRKGTKKPYSIHPVSVGMLLIENGEEVDTICAGILHDTLEDTTTTEEEIEKEFGPRVLQYVKEASEEDKSLSWEIRKTDSIEKMSKISKEGLMVVLADKTHNISSTCLDKGRVGKEEYWSGFNRGYTEQKWYYTELYKKFNLLIDRENSILKVYNEKYTELFGKQDIKK